MRIHKDKDVYYQRIYNSKCFTCQEEIEIEPRISSCPNCNKQLFKIVCIDSNDNVNHFDCSDDDKIILCICKCNENIFSTQIDEVSDIDSDND